ncbi:type II toxin-antitoxin system HicA family toxin [Motilimonas cestriensis]|uniref:type II toxin-antitoxin system HicA family toxin n=1 Tax=Motilimonas cestriensis TaxID=2742685 RepID=UPI003DA47F71
MSKHDKLLERLQTKPKDFTWDELSSLLPRLEFTVLQGSGSRVKFVHKTGQIISLHKPHPGNIIKPYIIKNVLQVLDTLGYIK